MSAGADSLTAGANATARARGALWPNLWVRLAVALAFADASIVVLALPEIIDRLHTSIEHVVWVIVAYNLALIAGSAAIVPVAARAGSRRVLVAGLALFAAASLGCGASNSLSALIPLRCAQGIGGALILAASLPLFAGAARPGDDPVYGWSAAAAVGAAVGPAAGGLLTQVFDWRSIFFAQAPVAVFAAVAVLAVQVRPAPAPPAEPADERAAREGQLANVALLMLSAGMIGALFLVVIELINVWGLTPAAAAAIVTAIPLATALAERAVRGRSSFLLGSIGSILLAAGLVCLALIPQRELGLVVLALALCGAGLGLGFPGLTTAALASGGPLAGRAAKTVAARDAGLVLGLLVLTPVFVGQLGTATGPATTQAALALGAAPLPTTTKTALIPRLEAVAKHAGQTHPPDVGPVFARAIAQAPPAQRDALAHLRDRMRLIIQRAATHPFRRPLLYAAGFALLVLLALGSYPLLSRRL